ncbi:leucine-rich repeat family protein [Vigna unguiculata]|uniref:Leucine-rich repeat family protein n=1 Tax=Vigna unguiculata TaxID=3917 RepID=A0A4D6LN57_VIGUN|nr:leucine-rich repeat family protein [Vigna unguiculata]
MLYTEPEVGRLLSWSHKVNIVVGLASVLVYLHQECERRVVHRDIKTRNILLDGNMNPRRVGSLVTDHLGRCIRLSLSLPEPLLQ